MSYTLSASVEDRLVRVGMQGKWPHGNLGALMGEILELWREHRRLPLILDLRLVDDEPSVLEDYETARYFSEAGFSGLGRVVILDKLDRLGANEFFETAACNRGLSFRVFYSDDDEVLDWLLE